jgi:hypothetical protein|tara:strand:- start:3251 stop:4276 length:1026 start_codon:yes stop_codon:yes gene_type:complete
MSFKRFDIEDVVVSAESVTSPLWSGDSTTLSTFFTSSTQIGGTSADYYYDVYQATATSDAARVQFSIAYADQKGSGSLAYNTAVVGKAPSSTIYGQFRNVVLGDEESSFNFGGKQSEYFYVLAIDRARYREKLLPGSFELTLQTSGSNNSLTIIDNSSTLTTTTFTDAGRVYDLVSGSVASGVNTSINENGYTSNSGSYGKLLPDIGVVLLNGSAIDAPNTNGGIDLGTDRSPNSASLNPQRVFDFLKDSGSIRLQSEETISSNFVFVRARNGEFNYSTNPSLITGSGELRHDVMIDSPQSYITAVGLYNDNNDLLAVAKLSRPLLKDFTKETLVRIKLDY